MVVMDRFPASVISRLLRYDFLGWHPFSPGAEHTELDMFPKTGLSLAD